MVSKDGTTTGRWLRRITQQIAGEPQDREDIVQLLNEKTTLTRVKEEKKDEKKKDK